MSSKYKLFDPDRLSLAPLEGRIHDLHFTDIACPALRAPMATPTVRPTLRAVAKRLTAARDKKTARVLMMGAHVLRSGLQPYLRDMMDNGYISQIAVNGAWVIHDFELALIGATTESVAKYISEGQFGLWQETGCINTIVAKGDEAGMGLGETMGRAIALGDYTYKNLSMLAAAWERDIPVTVHVGIGQDIIHQHPNFDGGAFGSASYRDFLIYAAGLEKLEHGVVMNFGSAVMAPEVYLKALAMVRNVAAREGRSVSKFTTLVCDLHDLPESTQEEAPKGSAAYYFRPWKTMLVRTVADGGEGYYCKARHEESIPELWTALRDL